MAKSLERPERPLAGGRYWDWKPETEFVRLYHRSSRCPDGGYKRTFGPLHRFDPHTPEPPAEDPEGRSVAYLAGRVGTAGLEVYAYTGEALICPVLHLAIGSVATKARLQSLVGTHAVSLGAYHYLGTSDLPRRTTQEWARAIYEDHPAGKTVSGVVYRAAHDGGRTVAIWDTAPDLVMHTDEAFFDAMPLLLKFQTAMSYRRVTVRLVPQTSCPECLKCGLVDPDDYEPPD
jgi:hypothetical protein